MKQRCAGDWALRLAAVELRPQVGVDDSDWGNLVLMARTARQGIQEEKDVLTQAEALLAGGTWGWPHYDQWQAVFRATETWPVSWPWAELSENLRHGLPHCAGLVVQAMSVKGLRPILVKDGRPPGSTPRGLGAWKAARLEQMKAA